MAPRDERRMRSAHPHANTNEGVEGTRVAQDHSLVRDAVNAEQMAKGKMMQKTKTADFEVQTSMWYCLRMALSSYCPSPKTRRIYHIQ